MSCSALTNENVGHVLPGPAAPRAEPFDDRDRWARTGDATGRDNHEAVSKTFQKRHGSHIAFYNGPSRYRICTLGCMSSRCWAADQLTSIDLDRDPDWCSRYL